jgi:uncharacterized protein with PIN domain
MTHRSEVCHNEIATAARSRTASLARVTGHGRHYAQELNRGTQFSYAKSRATDASMIFRSASLDCALH